MAGTSTVESFQFQAETTQLLHLMIHSLLHAHETFFCVSLFPTLLMRWAGFDLRR